MLDYVNCTVDEEGLIEWDIGFAIKTDLDMALLWEHKFFVQFFKGRCATVESVCFGIVAEIHLRNKVENPEANTLIASISKSISEKSDFSCSS